METWCSWTSYTGYIEQDICSINSTYYAATMLMQHQIPCITRWDFVYKLENYICMGNSMCREMDVIPLTHWGRDKMAAIFQTTFSNAFSWMKMNKFWLRFHRSLFPRVQLTIFQHWFRYWLGAIQVTSHYLNQWWLVDWRIYASLGLSELMIMVTRFCWSDGIIQNCQLFCCAESI